MRYMDDKERDETALAGKELKRQWARMAQDLDEETLQATFESPVGRAADELMRAIVAGELSAEDIERRTEELNESIGRRARELDVPDIVMQLDTEKEAQAKSQPMIAQFLAADAVRRASDGLSQEQWILEVIAGHGTDESAQIGCLSFILTLHRDGPWAWPRD
jgi:hypothetical protein